MAVRSEPVPSTAANRNMAALGMSASMAVQAEKAIHSLIQAVTHTAAAATMA